MNSPARSVKDLVAEYRKRKSDIKKRLEEFSRLHKGRNEDIFQEICVKAVEHPRVTACICEGRSVNRSRIRFPAFTQSISGRVSRDQRPVIFHADAPRQSFPRNTIARAPERRQNRFSRRGQINTCPTRSIENFAGYP